MDETEGFWAPVSPAYNEPTDEQLAELRTELGEVAWRFAERISARPGVAGAPTKTRESLRLLQDMNLSVLRALREMGPAAEELSNEVASRAGSQMATYVQLGAAWGISRQAARGRWPGVTRIMGVQYPEPTQLEMGGGEARISWHADESGWWWIATAANQRTDEAAETYDTREEAIVHAGAFLLANAEKTTKETR